MPALASCKGGSDQSIIVDVIGSGGDPFEAGIRLSPAGQMVRAATAEGLVGFDAEGRVIPALADRWIVTDDGLSYIFRLSDGKWSDGSELSGESARDALRQQIAALAGTPLGRDLAGINEVRAMAGRVVELRLSYPMPDLLDLLAQPELSLARRSKATGLFLLKRDGSLALLQPRAPEARGMAVQPGWQDSMRAIRLHALPITAAIKRFENGDTGIVLGGHVEDYPQAREAAGISRRALRLDPVTGLFGLVILNGDGWLANPDAREALAMAVDRDALAAELAGSGWTPTTRIIAPSVADAPTAIGERWTGINVSRRRTEAAARLVKSAVKGGHALTLKIALPSGIGADVIYNRLAADFGAIGIKLQRAELDDNADLRLVDLVARYSRADWFLQQLSCSTTRGLCSSAADKSAEAARQSADPARRAALLADAEAELTSANVFIPLGSPIRWSLIRDPVPGFIVNHRGIHPLPPIAARTN